MHHNLKNKVTGEKDQIYWLSSQEQIVDCGISFDHPGKVSSFPYNNQYNNNLMNCKDIYST